MDSSLASPDHLAQEPHRPRLYPPVRRQGARLFVAQPQFRDTTLGLGTYEK